MTDWKSIDKLPRYRGKREKIVFFYPEITGSRHASNNKSEMVSFDNFGEFRPPTMFAVVTFP